MPPGTPATTGAHVRVLLVPIYSQLGRLDEAQLLLEEWWERSEPKWRRRLGAGHRPGSDAHRAGIQARTRSTKVRAYLDEAGRRAPDDDRVWLGRANLAIRTGDIQRGEAVARRVPEAPSRGWRGLVRPAPPRDRHQSGRPRAAGPDAPCRPMRSTAAEVHRLGAWLCARRGDHERERRELERLHAVDPADLRALDRLARLAEKAGHAARAQELRGKSAEIVTLRARYEKLFDRNQPIRDAEEMAQIAERLGRLFEARAFLTVEISADPRREDLRRNLRQLVQRAAPSLEGVRTLAEVVAHELQGERKDRRGTRTLIIIEVEELDFDRRWSGICAGWMARRQKGRGMTITKLEVELRPGVRAGRCSRRFGAAPPTAPAFASGRPTRTSRPRRVSRCGATVPATTRLSQGALDPLMAKAIVIAAGDDKVALVGIDLGRGPTEAMMKTIRREIAEKAGIRNVMITGSHTHHGPVIELIDEPGLGKGKFDVAVAYSQKLPQLLVEVILDADKDLEAGQDGSRDRVGST